MPARRKKKQQKKHPFLPYTQIPKEDPDRSGVKSRGQHGVSRHVDPLEPANKMKNTHVKRRRTPVPA